MTDASGNLDQAGRTPLHYAALAGDMKLIVRLLDEGADASLPDLAGFTPLHFAVQEQKAAVVPVLTQAGAAVDAQDTYGNTPLWRAVVNYRGDGHTIEALLAQGADPDLPNQSGVSPRRLAETIQNYDVARHIP